MHTLIRAGRNLAFKTTGEVLSRLAFLVLFIAAARALGSADYGRFNYAVSLAGLALVGMDLGLNTLLVREVARQPQELGRWLGSLLVIKLILAGVILAGLAWGLGLAGAEQASLILAVAGVQVLWGLSELGAAGLAARERMDLEAGVKSATRLVALLLAGWLMWTGHGLYGLVLGLAGANALAAAANLSLTWRLAPWRVGLSLEFLGRLIKGALPLAFTGVFILIYSRVDVVMLSALGRTFAEVGWYTAAMRVTDALGILAGLVAASLLPVMADLHQRQPEDLARLYRQGLRLLLLVGLPAAAGLLLERQAVVMAVFGPVYVPAAAAFLWLAPTVALVFVNYLQLTTLAALGRQRLGAASTGLALLVNLGLNWWWIPRFGYLGAAAATLATEAVLLLLNAWFLRRVAGLEWPFAAAWRPLIATAVIALFLVLEPGWGLGLVIPLAMAVYAGAALGCRAVQWGELAQLWTLLRRRPAAPAQPTPESSPEPPAEAA